MKKKRILLLCRQNVGRSQMAEGYVRSIMGNSVAVSSAGIESIKDMKRKYHNRPNPQVVDVIQQDGIDISKQRINGLTRRKLRKADIIIVFFEQEFLPQFALKYLDKMKFFSIEDPANGMSNKIPTLDAGKLRKTGDAIKQVILTIAERR